MSYPLIALAVVATIVVLYVLASLKVVQEYERGVVFRLGKVRGARPPGLHIVPAVFERMVKVSLQVTTIDIPPQELITSDSVTVEVTAVAWFHVVDPVRALVTVSDYYFATAQLANATLLSALREVPLDSLLRHRAEIQERLTVMMDETTRSWGLAITLVEVKDVRLPESMRRSMAKEAEAERERRAKIVSAQGELEAAGALSKAAELIDVHPSALRLRELSTLVEIAAEKNSTILFPMPVELQRLATALEHRLAPAAAALGTEEEDAPAEVVATGSVAAPVEPPARVRLDRTPTGS